MCGVTRGVHQRSILGPLLFSVYMNNIFHVLSFTKGHLYADDLQLVAHGTDSLILQDRVNEELIRKVNWCYNNKLIEIKINDLTV